MLQLYAFLCAQTGCLITGRLPGAKAINALIQAEKNPDNAPARLSRIIQQQKRRQRGAKRKPYNGVRTEEKKRCAWAVPRGYLST